MFFYSFAVDDDVAEVGNGKRQALQYFIYEFLKVHWHLGQSKRSVHVFIFSER